MHVVHTIRMDAAARGRRSRAGAFIALAVGAFVALGAAAPAEAAADQLTASPSSIAVGESTTITATGLGGLETASFGLGDLSAGTFQNGGTSYDAPVSDGTATATFTGAAEGEFTVSVGDGETVLGTTVVTITAATPTATPSPTPTPAPTSTSAPEGLPVGVVVGLVIGAVVLVAAIVVTWVMLARRRTSATGTSATDPSATGESDAGASGAGGPASDR